MAAGSAQEPRPILLTGASGQVGGALLERLQALGPGVRPVSAPTRAELDMADAAAVAAFVRELRPSLIVNPAAYTAVDKAESEPDLAFAINRDAVAALGREAAMLDIPVIHFSTDYVFPGTGTTAWRETDATAPPNVYGASKLAGEQALAASGAAYLVLRTSWVYGATGKNFVRTILKYARERAQMTIVADQIGAPTSSGSLAALTMHLIDRLDATGSAAQVRAQQGVYHAAAAGQTSWHGLAEAAVHLMQQREPATTFAELKPIPTSDYPTPARRPLNSRLDCSLLTATFGYSMPGWRDSLAEVIDAL